VNTTVNLLFTAEFNLSQGTLFKTSRFIASTVFSMQKLAVFYENCEFFSRKLCFREKKKIQDPALRSTWIALDQASGSKIVLSTYPVVVLSPCFSRGGLYKKLLVWRLRSWCLMLLLKNYFSEKVLKRPNFPSLKQLALNSLKELALSDFTTDTPFVKNQSKNLLSKLSMSNKIEDFIRDLTAFGRRIFADMPSFYFNLFNYTETFKLFFISVEEYFGDLDLYDILVFENRIENYCKNMVNFESNLELYQKL